MSVMEPFTELVTDCSAKTLQAIIRGKVSPESIIHFDCWKDYGGLVDVGYDKHFRINKFYEAGIINITVNQNFYL
ncbi:hypothetical protein AXF15_08975 [Desulfomicrobium orale DSM 12838]|uniref:ISXO2-like transposase domain-containing protein n=1 Tax=Desulfomicrobium orale DSM 12838 TaxID=888061 RepID=A0A0X8JQT5_9BACT|nr:hypothetical protein AXF15_08975 [Desulfomicrobium orale DSM 12838]